MQAWGGLSLTNVNAGGVFTQLYPTFLQQGSLAAGVQTRRRPNEGVLGRMEVVPSAGVGGVFELWDASGLLSGANEVNNGVTVTAAFMTAEELAKRARCVWKVDFDGDLDGTNKLLGVRVIFARGLIARYVHPDPVGTNAVTINLVVDGGFQLIEGELPG